MYYIALIPPDPVQSAVQAFKYELKNQFGAKNALKSPAHITLQKPFRRPQSMESQLIDQLTGFAEQQTPFEIKLNGFDCFEPRVLFVAVQNPEIIRPMRDALYETLIQHLDFQEKEIDRRFHPHITIANRDLKEVDFDRTWPYWQKKPFQASFFATDIHLLRLGPLGWEVLHAMPFESSTK